jgi:hypothetical protein
MGREVGDCAQVNVRSLHATVFIFDTAGVKVLMGYTPAASTPVSYAAGIEVTPGSTLYERRRLGCSVEVKRRRSTCRQPLRRPGHLGHCSGK